MATSIGTRIGIRLRAAAIASGILLMATPSSADALACLNATGYAFEDFGSAVRLHGGITYAFPLLGAHCDPPLEDEIALTATGGAGILNYRVGFGLQVETGAIATPDVSGASEGRARLSQIWWFTVVPDDPESTAAVPITIKALHRFGRVRTDSTDLGVGENAHVGRYSLGRTNGPQLAAWNSEGLTMTEDDAFQVTKNVDAPVNERLILFASLEHSSFAHANPSGQAGSGSAEAGATVTYEVSTEADATILFDVETKLGVAPPSLDVVTVPEPAAGALGSIAVLCIVAIRRSAVRA